MLYQQISPTQLHAQLPLSPCSVSLTAYARPHTGMVADDGARWAVLILPGGGYEVVAPGEGEPVALAFLNAGVQAFVLEYSVSPVCWPQAFLEAAAALSFLRRNASHYGVRPDHIAVCGFSAGGHLAGCLSNLWNSTILRETLGLAPAEVRPDAAILSYPVISAFAAPVCSSFRTLLGGDGPIPEALSLERSVTPENPPAFLWTTSTDGSVSPENTLLYANALRENGVPYELHVFSQGPHAMGLATRECARDVTHYDARAAHWHSMCIDWLKTL